MLLKTKGRPNLIEEPIVAKVSRLPLSGDQPYLLLDNMDLPFSDPGACVGILSSSDYSTRIDFPSVYNIPSFDHLLDGDIVLVNTDGIINTLYRINSHQNFLLLTERCNSNCLMCSQPPRDRDDSYLMRVHKELVPLIPKDCIELGLTGGEPTLAGDAYFDLLSTIKMNLPDTEIHCLTNGRSFAWKAMADKLASLEMDRLMLGIPLYADHYQIHDYIVQADHAFDQTMKGFYNLATNNQRIEIRVVLHKLTIPRIRQLAQFVYKNLPFADHIAFMGLEYQGYTPHNIDKLWIDPIHYMDALADAVYFLHDAGMRVSIYNSQLCTMPESLWKFNRRSISDWKNVYLDECNSCAMREACGGLFASGIKKHSDFIRPFIQIPVNYASPI